MLPRQRISSKSSLGVIHFTLLLVLALIVFVAVTLLPPKSTRNIQSTVSVLSKDEDNTGSNSGPGSGSIEDDEVDNDELEVTKFEDDDEGEDLDEVEDEIEELEFEDGDEIDEEEDEVEELVEGDSEQKVEVKVENGKVVIKIKTRNRLGREVEEELEATNSAQIASLKLKVKKGEIKLKLRSENGKIILVEEEAEGEILALTDLPLTIDSENNLVTVHATSGDININQFPGEVLSALLSSQNLDQLKSLQLKVKQENGETKVVYHAKGENNVKFLGLFNVEAEVEAEVDAQTAESEVIKEPWYLKYLSFLFTQ